MKMGRKKKIQYNRKCNGCDIYYPHEELINCLGCWKCEECLSHKTIQGDNGINLPPFMLKRKNMSPGDKIKLEIVDEGILIRKVGL